MELSSSSSSTSDPFIISHHYASWYPTKMIPIHTKFTFGSSRNSNRAILTTKMSLNDSGVFSISDDSNILYSSSDIAPSISSSLPKQLMIRQHSRQTNNYHQQPSSSSIKHGSLESINFDEEEENYSSSEESSTKHLAFLQPSNSDPINGESTIPSSKFSGHSSLESLTSLRLLDEQFTNNLGYSGLEEILLYYYLNGFSTDNQCSPDTSCSRLVNRFGEEYRDVCQFPLVLPLFNVDILEKRSSFLTWDRLMLEADVCLSLWEISAINNLRLQHKSVILGKPSDWITIDPNHHLRQICKRRHDISMIRSMAQKERHQALKHWSSMEDLIYDLPRFQNDEFKFDSNFTKRKTSRTDDSIVINMDSQNDLLSELFPTSDAKYGNSSLFKSQNNYSSASFNKLISSIKSRCQEDSAWSNSLEMIHENSLYLELSSLLQFSSPVHFCLYLTKFYQEHFHFRINHDVLMFSSLVLLKEDLILRKSYDKSSSKFIATPNNLSWQKNLNHLLKFDDTLVSVVHHHLTQYRPNQSLLTERAKRLADLIESACLMRQLRNFHGLQVLVGAIQSPKLYFDVECWSMLQHNHPVHYQDYRRLSVFCRQMSRPGSMLSCVGLSHLPPFQSIINRLRLSCSTAWNLIDAHRRFTDEPSMALWIEDQMISQKDDSEKATVVFYHQKGITTNKYSQLQTSLQYDPFSETFLSNCSGDTVRVINFDDYPEHIRRQKYLGSMPEHFFRYLIHHKTWETFFNCEMNQSFRKYKLPEKFY